MKCIEAKTIQGFGEEWSHFRQTDMSETDLYAIYRDYFSLLPAGTLNCEATAADIGCGSGRWAKIVAPAVKHLYLVDASEVALGVAKENLASNGNVSFSRSSATELNLPEKSLDFAYSLGVLHHLLDTQGALKQISNALRPGAPVLIYLYYSLENRPIAYRALWRASNVFRSIIFRLPKRIRFYVCDILAALVYWPLARSAAIFSHNHEPFLQHWPLKYYSDKSFYVMRTDCLDRFGTPLEKRFSRAEICRLMENADFEKVSFSERKPYWTLIAHKKG